VTTKEITFSDRVRRVLSDPLCMFLLGFMVGLTLMMLEIKHAERLCAKQVQPPKTSNDLWLFTVETSKGNEGVKIDSNGKITCVGLATDTFAYLYITSPEGHIVSRFKCLENGDLDLEPMGGSK
jgi:hypothetical protein